jgi:hypothetical protein
VSTATIATTSNQHVLLRRALLADGVFSGTTGILLIVAAGFLSEHFGLATLFLRLVGISLIPFAATLIYLAPRVERFRPLAWAVVAGNFAWAVASGLLLLSGWVEPTNVGFAFVIGQAVLVAGFADLQLIALRRSR